VIIVDQLPRNAMGKVVKEDVRELVLELAGQRQTGQRSERQKGQEQG